MTDSTPDGWVARSNSDAEFAGARERATQEDAEHRNTLGGKVRLASHEKRGAASGRIGSPEVVPLFHRLGTSPVSRAAVFCGLLRCGREATACEICVAVGMAHTTTFTERNRLPIPHRRSLADARDDSTVARDVVGPIAPSILPSPGINPVDPSDPFTPSS